jgi:CubicO group peptidase (beta-lactamase class C family)
MQRRLFLILLPALVYGQLSQEKIRRIEEVVGTEMARGSVPGVSVAIATGGQLRWAGGFGLSDIENLVPVTSATRIRLGSISKPITAVAIMQLVERGKIDLDAEIQRYVPSFPKKQFPVTIRALLGHQAGIRHYKGLEEVDSTVHYTDRVAPLKIFQDDPLLFEPGTKYSYTTYGYNLLGAAVEGVTDKKFEDYLRDNVFKQAGMTEISDDNVYEIIPHRARGYALRNGRLENCHLADTSNKIPGGGLISTASDLVKFALAVNRGALVKKETVQLMFTPQKLKTGAATTYGMGFAAGNFQGHATIGHGGGQQGITTYLQLLPGDNAAIAIMTNLEGNRSLNAIVQGVSRIVLEP